MCSSSTYRNWTCRCRAGFLTRQTSARDDARHEWESNLSIFLERFSCGRRTEMRSQLREDEFSSREKKSAHFHLQCSLNVRFRKILTTPWALEIQFTFSFLLLSRISVSCRLFEPRRRERCDRANLNWHETSDENFQFLQRFSPSLRKTRWWSTSSADDVQFVQNEAWHFLLILQYLTRNRLLPSAKERGYCVIDCLIIPASSSSSRLLSHVNLISNTSIFPHWRYNV